MVKIMENPIKTDNLGVPLFLETPMYLYNLAKWFIIFHQPIDFPEIAGDFQSKTLPFGGPGRVRSRANLTRYNI